MAWRHDECTTRLLLRIQMTRNPQQPEPYYAIGCSSGSGAQEVTGSAAHTRSADCAGASSGTTPPRLFRTSPGPSPTRNPRSIRDHRSRSALLSSDLHPRRFPSPSTSSVHRSRIRYALTLLPTKPCRSSTYSPSLESILRLLSSPSATALALCSPCSRWDTQPRRCSRRRVFRRART